MKQSELGVQLLKQDLAELEQIITTEEGSVIPVIERMMLNLIELFELLGSDKSA